MRRRRRYRRHALQCRPEEVLAQAGLEAPSVAAFLHENLPDFIAEDGIDSAASVYAHISTSGAGAPCTCRRCKYWSHSASGTTMNTGDRVLGASKKLRETLQSYADRLSAFRRCDYASEIAVVDDYAVSSVADSCAALVAARGVLFGNTDQAPRKCTAACPRIPPPPPPRRRFTDCPGLCEVHPRHRQTSGNTSHVYL